MKKSIIMKNIPLIRLDLHPDFRSSLLEWYASNHRKLPWRRTSDPYEIWISEVMLQQTQVTKVLEYYHPFIARFPDVFHLARADEQEVLKYWELLGYYSRARNLHKAARLVVEKFGGVIPQDCHDFRSLPGVGDYIAAAVLSIAYQRPYAVLDGNVKRVMSRLFLLKEPVNDSKAINGFRKKVDLLLAKNKAGQFNQAMMELGAVVCKPHNPSCPECPVKSYCGAFQSGLQNKFPVRIPQKVIPQYRISVGIVFKNNKVLITRRKDEGLLGGLWEFPGGKVTPAENSYQACIREIKEEVNLAVEIKKFFTTIKHAYTHFKIVMDVYICRYKSGRVKLRSAQDFRWINIVEIEKFPFPGANHKFIPKLKAEFSVIK
jgi:A/G-specific adenine glycosylase